MGIEQNQTTVAKRRQFIKKAGAGVAVSSLPMKSVWGACTVSGVMSGNLSQNGGGTGDVCGSLSLTGGRSPGFWYVGNGGINGTQGNSVRDVFWNQVMFGGIDNNSCLVEERIDAIRTLITGFYSTQTLTLSVAAAKYIYNSDSSYNVSPTLLQALSGAGLDPNRKSILKHAAVVYLNVYFKLYADVSTPLNHDAAMEAAEVIMTNLIQLQQQGTTIPDESDNPVGVIDLGYTDGASALTKNEFLIQFSGYQNTLNKTEDDVCPSSSQSGNHGRPW